MLIQLCFECYLQENEIFIAQKRTFVATDVEFSSFVAKYFIITA
jgi:hypothetical protein